MDDIGLDSTSTLEVLMEIEDRSALEVDPNELRIDDFETVDAFTRFLDRSIGSAEEAAVNLSQFSDSGISQGS